MSAAAPATIRVEGVDRALDAYCIACTDGDRTLRALVPQALIGGAAAPHQTAHEALARHARPILRAMRARAEGRTPRAPWDALTLAATSD